MSSHIELSANSDWIELKGPDSDNDSKGMVVINDLIDGNEYTLAVNYDVLAQSVSIKLKAD